ncbi:MAG TPA: hypothetical protein VGH19_06615 [Verrucomicrobiae bacterium]
MAGKNDGDRTENLFDAKVKKPVAAVPLPVVAASAPVGDKRLAEYFPPGVREPWRVERFDLLAAEFELEEGEVPSWHEVIHTFARTWLIVRRLYGVQPVLLPMNASAGDYKLSTMAELREELGISQDQLRQEILAGVQLWKKFKVQATAPVVVEAKPPDQPVNTLLAEEQMLERHGFPDRMFTVKDRKPEENRTEKIWFAGKVSPWRPMLEHPVAGEIAREALQCLLLQKRVEEKMYEAEPLTLEYDKAKNEKTRLLEQYNKLVESLNNLMPFAKMVAHSQDQRSILNLIIQGCQQYYADGENTILDGMNTGMEIECLLRMSQQMPDPRYRADIVVMVNSARAGLFNPKWTSTISHRSLKRVQEAWRETYKMLAKGDEIPDLLSDDPKAGEYHDLAMGEAPKKEVKD